MVVRLRRQYIRHTTEIPNKLNLLFKCISWTTRSAMWRRKALLSFSQPPSRSSPASTCGVSGHLLLCTALPVVPLWKWPAYWWGPISSLMTKTAGMYVALSLSVCVCVCVRVCVPRLLMRHHFVFFLRQQACCSVCLRTCLQPDTHFLSLLLYNFEEHYFMVTIVAVQQNVS